MNFSKSLKIILILSMFSIIPAFAQSPSFDDQLVSSEEYAKLVTNEYELEQEVNDVEKRIDELEKTNLELVKELEKFRITDQANVLELLGILLAILGVILGGTSAGIYKYLSWKIQNNSRERTEEAMKQRNADLYLVIGFNYWFQFAIQHKKNTDDYSKQEKDSHNENLVGLLSQAITITKKGIESCIGLDEKKNEEIIGLLKNNYAYFVTELSDPIPVGEKKLAQAYADFLNTIQTKYPEHIDHWDDTVNRVKKRFESKK